MNLSLPIQTTSPAHSATFAVLVAVLRTVKPKKRPLFLQELARQLYTQDSPTALHPAQIQAQQLLLWATPRARKAVGMSDEE